MAAAPSEGGGYNVGLLGAYALMLAVPIAELLAIHFGNPIPPVYVGQALLTIAFFTVGRSSEFWKAPVAKPYMAFMLLSFFAAVFGNYPGRSIPYISQYGLRIHVFPFYCCAIAYTAKQVRKTYLWLGGGAFLLLALCIQYGETLEDRFHIPDTTLSNPNDLGFAILFVMSGLLLLRSKLSRVLIALTLPVFFMYILRTGSRADLITLAVVMVIAFFFATAQVKMMMLIAAPLVMAAVAIVIPAQTLGRLTALVADPLSVQTNNAGLRGALDSQAARAALQRRAIELTLGHPLLGVGALNFQDAVEEMVQESQHQKSGWQVAHNTYLQIAAENGVPAFICYLWTCSSA